MLTCWHGWNTIEAFTSHWNAIEAFTSPWNAIEAFTLLLQEALMLAERLLSFCLLALSYKAHAHMHTHTLSSADHKRRACCLPVAPITLLLIHLVLPQQPKKKTASVMVLARLVPFAAVLR
jgi:hypothetical protein